MQTLNDDSLPTTGSPATASNDVRTDSRMNPQARPAFSARGISKVFQSSNSMVHALDDVSLDLAEGSFTCIVGPSGCGKSTLLRILGGLETQTSGDLTVNLPATKAPTSAFVFQEHGVFPWMNVLDNVAFGLHMIDVSRKEREETARYWVSLVGLDGFEKSYPHQLSGGMRQRIAIARAFATNSPSLLMDEPLGALDAQTRMLMQEQLLNLWQKDQKTVVLVTHAIEEALILGDQIIVMSARPGKIKTIIDVPFGRPRRMDIEAKPEFAALRHHIWGLLKEEVEASVKFS